MHVSERFGILGFQAKRIKSNVTRDVFGTKLTRLVIGDILRLNPSNLSTDGLSLGYAGSKENPEKGWSRNYCENVEKYCENLNKNEKTINALSTYGSLEQAE